MKVAATLDLRLLRQPPLGTKYKNILDRYDKAVIITQKKNNLFNILVNSLREFVSVIPRYSFLHPGISAG